MKFVRMFCLVGLSLLAASELSARLPANPPTIVSVRPNSGAGLTQTFTVIVNDPNGWADFNNIEVLFNSAPSKLHACDINFSVSDYSHGTPNFDFSLADDSGASYITLPPGNGGDLSNSQCTLNGNSVSDRTLYSESTNTLTLVLSVTFSPIFVGQKNIYVYAQELDHLDSGGFQQEGSWTIGTAPSVLSATPDIGLGTKSTFSVAVNDPNGVADLNNIQLLLNTTANRAGGCNVSYDIYTRSLSLYNDAGSGFVGALSVGSSAQVSNSQCTLSGTGSGYPSAGDLGVLSAALSFAPSFAGTKNTYAYVQGNNGLNNGGWQLQGSYTPFVPAEPTWSIVSLTPNLGSGATQTFSLLADGSYVPDDLNNIQLLFNTTATRAGGCNVSYDVYTNTLSLYNNEGSAFVGSLVAGSVGQISNGQCTLNVAASAYGLSAIGSNPFGSALNVTLSFSSTFNAPENIYAYLQDNNGNNTGWTPEGVWASPTSPAISSLSPNSGSGLTQTFTLAGTDPNGTGDVNNVQLLLNASPERVNGCNVSYDVYSNIFSLYNDTGTGFVGAVAPGSATQVSNSRCTLSGAGSSWNSVGKTFSLTVQLAFSTTFAGQQNVYVYAQGNAAGPSGSWTSEGNWTP